MTMTLMVSASPAVPVPAFSRDDHAHMADRIMSVFPSWLVLWGTYSREFWAFPCFGVPGGGYVHSPDASRLAGMMHRLQRSAEEEPQ